MARSLNKVLLIGNLTRDPELRYTPQGTAVATFGLATNRQWATDTGEKKEDVEFHRVVAWNKLAEICGQLLAKGKKVFIEGRLQTREWTGDDNAKRTVTEVVASEMILLDSKGAPVGGDDFDVPNSFNPSEVSEKKEKPDSKKEKTEAKPETVNESSEDEEEIPF